MVDQFKRGANWRVGLSPWKSSIKLSGITKKQEKTPRRQHMRCVHQICLHCTKTPNVGHSCVMLRTWGIWQSKKPKYLSLITKKKTTNPAPPGSGRLFDGTCIFPKKTTRPTWVVLVSSCSCRCSTESVGVKNTVLCGERPPCLTRPS